MQKNYFFLFILFVFFLTNCSKTNNQNGTKNEPTPKSSNIWKVNSKKSYSVGEKITISLQNISDKSVLIEYPDITKIEKKIGQDWQEIRLSPYSCRAQAPLRKYRSVNSLKTRDYSWNQKEKWCEGNTEKTKTVSKGEYRLKVSYSLEEDGFTEKYFVLFEIK